MFELLKFKDDPVKQNTELNNSGHSTRIENLELMKHVNSPRGLETYEAVYIHGKIFNKLVNREHVPLYYSMSIDLLG